MAKRDKRFYEQLVHDAAEQSCTAFNTKGYSSRPRHVAVRRQDDIIAQKEKKRGGGIDECYARIGNSFKGKFSHPDIPETEDLLATMHEIDEEFRAAADSPEELQKIVRMFEVTMLRLLEQFFNKKMLPKDFVQACEAFADLAVRDTLIEGNGIGDIDYAKRFLTQLRKEYAKVDNDMEILSQLKRVEDKLDLGKEACEVMHKQVNRQYGVYDLFDYSMREVMARRNTADGTDGKHAPTDEELEAALAFSDNSYRKTLNGIGLDNVTLQHSYYTMALVQRAAYVAQAEFMRLPKDHADRQGNNQVENRNRYISQRMPELVKEVLEKYPPVTMGDLALKTDSENIYTHSADALFNAIKWLDHKRAMVASIGR